MVLRQAAKSSVLMAVCAALLFACDYYPVESKNGELSDMQDRQQELTRQDYRNMNKIKKLLEDEEPATGAELGQPPIPDLAQVLAAPRPPKVANTKLVTISVTEDVPVRDVLFELGRLANVDIEVGRGLDSYGINLRATDRPFNEVIERISDLAGLRYSVHGNAIRVERDTAYIKNYNLDFINVVRSSTNSYTLSTSILSSGGSSGGSTSSSSSGSSGTTGGTSVGTSGSSASITSQAESDLWSSLEASITEILNYLPTQGNAALTSDSATAAAGAGSAITAATTSGASGSTAAGFVINRQAGILSVNATERQHEMVQRFLTMIGRNASAQVLIEAKIVEVSLDDKFLSGIDWNGVLGSPGGIFTGITSTSGLGFQPSNPDINFGTNGAAIIGINEGDLNGVVRLTERFGTTRTLSSPRLSAINNQQAVLTFARNEVFYTCESGEIAYTSGNNPAPIQTPPECTAQTVPIGIILNIMPSINLETQEVTLSVRPTLTRKAGDATSPQSVDDAPITTPIIEVREIDSVMKVRSGGIMIIGGLMEDNSTTENSGVPGLAELPFVGSAFKSRDESYGKRELIIFIKATIVNSDGNAHPVDKKIYDRFTTDPRPLFPKKEDAR